MFSRRRAGGFTLIELMIAIAVLAILIAMAMPSFQSTLRSNRVATASNELLASLSLARSEAVRNTRGAGVCASADGSACGTDWEDGWLVWDDLNGNGVLDTGETVVRYSQARSKIAVSGSAAAIVFDARGRAGSEQTVGIKPDGVDAPARCVTISITGQARVGKEACS